jgi:hypothetical protein
MVMVAAAKSPVRSRTFTATRNDSTTVTLSVRQPDRAELEAADLEYSAKFNQCLFAGLPTRSRMLAQLRKVGLWTTAQEQQMLDLRNEGLALEKRLADDKFATADDKGHATGRHREILVALNDLRTDLDTMLGQTSDAKADQARRDFLLACTVEYAEPCGDKAAGSRLWGSVEDYYNEPDGVLTERVQYESIMFINGVDSQWVTLFANPDATQTGKSGDAKRTSPAETATTAPSAPQAAPADTVATPATAATTN